MRRLVRSIRSGSQVAAHRLVKAVLGRFGYDFQLFPRSSRDATAVARVRESEFYQEWSTPSAIWAPWLGDGEFRAVYDGIEPYTVVSSDRCYVLYCLARQAVHLAGDFAECGVYRGGTALLLSRLLGKGDATLYLFDSFQGLPKPDAEKDPFLREGLFRATSAEGIAKLLSDFRDVVDLRGGWIPGSFAGLEDRRFALVHVDVDLYQSTLDCCEFFYPRLIPGGVVVFDDYGFPAARGEKEAVDEFFADKPEHPMALPTGQAIVAKLAPESSTRRAPAQEPSGSGIASVRETEPADREVVS